MSGLTPPPGALWLTLVVALMSFGISLAAFSMALVALIKIIEIAALIGAR